jgi:hypothetical protein
VKARPDWHFLPATRFSFVCFLEDPENDSEIDHPNANQHTTGEAIHG